MTTPNATVAPPVTTAARRYSEQIHVLTDRQTHEYVLGLAVLAAEIGNYSRPKLGEQVRDLLDDAIARAYKRDPELYRRAVQAGRGELAYREAQAEERQAETTRRIAAVAGATT
jgi:hypothetical protein